MRGNTHDEKIPLDAKKRVMGKIFVPLEEHVKQGTSTLGCNDEENIVYVSLNKGTIKDALHAWISVTLRIGVGRMDMNQGSSWTVVLGRV
jgi:hypothetical protein